VMLVPLARSITKTKKISDYLGPMLTRIGQHCFKSQCKYLIIHTTKYEIIGVKILHKFPRLGSFCWKPTSTNHFNAMKASQPVLLNYYRKRPHY